MSAINGLIATADLGAWPTLGLILLIAFLAGFMLDPLVIISIIVPIAAPVITGLGFDLVWFCVVFLAVLQTAYLTPPMAPSIFYLRGIAPARARTRRYVSRHYALHRAPNPGAGLGFGLSLGDPLATQRLKDRPSFMASLDEGPNLQRPSGI
jgi:hypothetical protein